MVNKEASQQVVIRRSNELIQARYKLTVEEQRLVLLLSSIIRADDEDFKDYEIRVSDFVQMFGLEKRKAIYKSVEDAANELAGKKINLSKDGKKIYASWLSYVEYVEGSGIVKLRFDKSLKPYLLQLKANFTQYNLACVINFKSSYSIRLYELLKMEVWKAEKAKIIKFEKNFSLDEYRHVLGVDKKAYPIFADLRKWVIEPPVNEVTEQTDLEIVETRYIKTGRKITGITFVVKIRQADKSQALKLEMEVEPPKEQPHPIIERLISLGFGMETAKQYKTKYGIKRIERNIAYTLAKKQEGIVKDIPPYLNKAIVEDMGGGWEVMQSKQNQEKAEQQAQAAKREQLAAQAHQKMTQALAAEADKAQSNHAKNAEMARSLKVLLED